MFYDYIFIAPISNLAHLIHRGETTEIDIKKTIIKIIDVANNLNKKVIAVSDAYYLDSSDKIAHSVYVHTKQVGGGSHRFYRYSESNEVMPDLHLRTTKEMLKEFTFLKDEQKIKDIVVNNSKLFLEQIKPDIKPIKTGSYRPKLGDVATKLKELVNQRIYEVYGDTVPAIIMDRINHELKMIVDNDYSIIY
jgi:DNA polymerase-3 subunit alpha (Gram-positive type)